MKLKKIIIVIICTLCLPFMVNAKEYCKVVSGNGKDIGSEIACGTEHFYIVDSNNEEVKMLAKYNLDVGISVHKEAIKKEAGDTRTDEEYCTALALEKGGQAGASVAEGYCFYFTYADFSNVKQREDAKSAHVDDQGNYLFPQIGNVYPSLVFSAYNQNFDDDIPVDFQTPKVIGGTGLTELMQMLKTEKYDGYFGDLEPALNEPMEQPSQIPQYFVSNAPSRYTNELGASLYYYKNKFNGFNVKELSLLTLDDLNNIAKKRGKTISYSTIYSNGQNLVNADSLITTFASLKEYVNKEDAWLYDRSYWLRTAYAMDLDTSIPWYSNMPGLLFVNNLGDICGAAGFGLNTPGCQNIIRVAVGSGVRPTITIPTSELQYLIKTETDGNGTIDVIETALGNDTIQFKATSKKGYKLKSIVIKTDSGETVKFDEGEIIENGDETYSVDKNKFTMPFENVTIQARWGLDILNPKTGMFYHTLFIILFIIGISTYIYKKKNLKNN